MTLLLGKIIYFKISNTISWINFCRKHCDKKIIIYVKAACSQEQCFQTIIK